MKKTLFPWFATLALSVVCCFASRLGHVSGTVFTVRPQNATEEIASPPAMLSMAGGVLVLLGLVRRRHNA